MQKIKEAGIRKNIGPLLKSKRIHKGISQSELSDRVKISRTFLNLVENGRRVPSYKTVEAIATHLDEDMPNLVAEAKRGYPEPEVRLAVLLAELLRSRDKQKLNRLIDFVQSLR